MSAAPVPPWAVEPLDERALEVEQRRFLEPVDADVETDRWSITSESDAEWAMARAAAAAAALREIADQRLIWQRQLDDWHKEATARLDSDVAFFGWHLEKYGVDRRLETGGKIKTIRFPSGDVKTTERQPTIVVADESLVLEWLDGMSLAEADSGIVKTTRKVLLAPLREQVTIDDDRVLHVETGEIVPGVAIQPGKTTGTVKPQAPFQTEIER